MVLVVSGHFCLDFTWNRSDYALGAHLFVSFTGFISYHSNLVAWVLVGLGDWMRNYLAETVLGHSDFLARDWTTKLLSKIGLRDSAGRKRQCIHGQTAIPTILS